MDVWALGVAMHALLTGTWPFDNEDDDELMDAIIACDLDFNAGEAWADISVGARDLLGGLLDPDPKHRLTAAQALEHVWFTGQARNTSARLHHVHARLGALAGSSRQHPERRFRPGSPLVRQGVSSEEVFMITAGECEVVVNTTVDRGSGEATREVPVEAPVVTADTAEAADDDGEKEAAETEAATAKVSRAPPREQHLGLPQPQPRKSTSGTWTIVGRRRKGNLVGELPHDSAAASLDISSTPVAAATTSTDTPAAALSARFGSSAASTGPVPSAPSPPPAPPSAVTVIAKTEVGCGDWPAL